MFDVCVNLVRPDQEKSRTFYRIPEELHSGSGNILIRGMGEEVILRDRPFCKFLPRGKFYTRFCATITIRARVLISSLHKLMIGEPDSSAARRHSRNRGTDLVGRLTLEPIFP